MNWKVQAFRAVVVHNAPGYDRLRRWKRRRSGYAPNLSNFKSTCSSLSKQLDLMRACGLAPAGKTIMEVGSGWFPLIPLLYRCLGAKHVVMTDVSAHMDIETLHTARRFVLEHLPELAGTLNFDARQDWLRGGSFEDLGLAYLAPFDPMRSELEVDMIVSRTVLEHIEPRVLKALAVRWHSFVKPKGFMVHSVDHSDHREHVDKTLSRIDFLTWSETAWDLAARIAIQQWRLRHSDYERLFAATGWSIEAQDTYTCPRALKDAGEIPLRYPFDTLYSARELGIVTSHFLLRSQRHQGRAAADGS